jgi:hypothetical protein
LGMTGMLEGYQLRVETGTGTTYRMLGKQSRSQPSLRRRKSTPLSGRCVIAVYREYASREWRRRRGSRCQRGTRRRASLYVIISWVS